MSKHYTKELIAGCSCLQCLRRAWRVEVAGECWIDLPDGMMQRVHEEKLNKEQARIARRLVRGYPVPTPKGTEVG